MPNRVLRDWTTSDKMDKLSLGAEVTFTRLIMKADDYGSFHANIKLIKAAIFPLKDFNEGQIASWINECIVAKLLFLYSDGERQYLRINDFGQRLRAMRSTFPQPADNPLTSDSTKPPETKRNEVETESETETKACENFDGLFLKAFDEQTCESYKMPFRGIDLGAELQKFRTKCDNNKGKYYAYDVGALRSAFQYQLTNVRSNGKGSNNKQQHTDSIKDTIRNTYGYTGK